MQLIVIVTTSLENYHYLSEQIGYTRYIKPQVIGFFIDFIAMILVLA